MITANTYLPPLFENGVLKYEIIDERRIRVYSMIEISRRGRYEAGIYADQFLEHPPLGLYTFRDKYWSEKNEKGHEQYVVEIWYSEE